MQIRKHFIGIAISTFAIVLAGFHILHDSVEIDAVGIALLVIADLPWIAPFLSSLELPGGIKFSFRDEIQALDYVPPQKVSSNMDTVFEETESVEDIDLSTKKGREYHREKIYDDNHNLFLVHVLKPSKKRGQKFDVFIYLVHHKGFPLEHEDIERAEFFFGKYWGNEIYSETLKDGVIGISTSTYGSFLCTCLIKFKDENKSDLMLNRYIDLEMGYAIV